MPTPFEYAEKQKSNFVDELKVLLRIPSISTLSEHKADIQQAAEWLRDHMLAIGMTKAEVMPTPGHPIVYGEWLEAGEDKPTVLVYGHYDVQPVDPLDKWITPPFEPEERNGNLYARGSTDDKGQTFIHLKAFESFMKTQGTFPLNIKIMMEGEEENGSVNLTPFIEKYQEMLKADVVVISDTHLLAEDRPSIVTSLRGLMYAEIEVFGLKDDLHSGIYGGAVHNPAQALVEILARLHDENGHITVPGFYDDVVDLSPAERESLAKIPWTDDEFKAETGLDHDWGEPEFTRRERVGARPTLEINGLLSGWTGEGAKTVIGSKALAKVSCRLVANQQPVKIFELLQGYVAEITPPTIQSEVRLLHTGHAARVDVNAPAMQVAVNAYKTVFGVEPVFMLEGGSIPVVADYQRLLNVPVILMGFGLPDDNLHAPNEKFTLNMFHKGIQTVLHFYEQLPEALA